MRALAPALAMLLAGLTLAAAQPNIPPSDRPGRERERFIESPVERFMKPGPTVEPPVVDRGKRPRKGRKLRSGRTGQ